MKTTILFALFLFYIVESYCQEAAFDWAGSVGSSTVENSRAITVDASGNTYITGTFVETMDFDPGPGIYELSPIGGFDCFITKLNSFGHFEWCMQIAGTGTDVGYDICTDNFGFIYLTGAFSNVVDFDPGLDVFEMTAESSVDFFILKLTVDRDFVWAKSCGDALQDSGKSITTDDDGNVYTSGIYNGTVDFDPGPDLFDITSEGEEDVFIQKLDSDGNFMWAKSIGGEAEDKISSIRVDSDENIYLGGNYEGTSDFDPGIGVFTFSSTGFFDNYIIKLNPEGNFQWAVTFGGSSGDEFSEFDIDNDGGIYAIGNYTGTIDFDPGVGIYSQTSVGELDVFIQKLDTEGSFVWAKSLGGSDTDRGYGIKIDELGNIYSVGSFKETADFDPSAASHNLTSAGSTDIFIQKLNPEGNFVWAKSMGSDGVDDNTEIALHPSGDIYLTGEYENTVDFNPGAAEFNLTSEGSRDIFVLKLNACSPDAVSDEITACISYTWTNGVTYYEDNNSATQDLLNIDGCDSIVTLDLTINEVDITTTSVGGVITSNATGATFQWLDCNDGYSEIDGETNESYTPSEDGDYAVKVTIGECTDTSACVAIDGVGIDESPTNKSIILYPNPNKGQFIIQGLESNEYRLIVYSISGKQIKKQAINGVDQFEVILPKGHYLLELISDHSLNHFRVVVLE